MWIPIGAALIREWHLFEARRLLEEIGYLKYNTQKKPTATKNENVVEERKHFTQAQQRKLSKVNINNNQTFTFDEKLQSLYLTKTRPQKQGKSNSSTDNQKTNNNDGIKQLEEQIRTLKEKVSNNMNKMNDTNNINQQITEQSHYQSHSEDVNVFSPGLFPNQNQNIEVIEVIEFIAQTMGILKMQKT